MEKSVTLDSINQDFLLNLIPEELQKIEPEMKTLLKEHFEGTNFDCNECGGNVIPYNLTHGVCFQCRTTAELQDLDYESTEDENAPQRD
jgi:hypothetical protein